MSSYEDEVTQSNVDSYRKYLVEQAQSVAPKSIFNKPAVVLHHIFSWLFIPLILLQLISTLVLGCLASITFGLLLVPISIIWWPFLGFILASSWLWYHMGFLRVILLVPGVFISELASNYVGLMPSMGEWYSRAVKLAICESWPHSIPIFRGQVK